jgi:hypothetical protein
VRVIGIRHRVKKTAEGEARPTQVVILENGEPKTLELETETDELDFVLGRFPTSFRKVYGSEVCFVKTMSKSRKCNPVEISFSNISINLRLWPKRGVNSVASSSSWTLKRPQNAF